LLGLPFLKIGTTIVFFQLKGKMPCLREAENKMSVKSSANSLRNLAEMLSGPEL